MSCCSRGKGQHAFDWWQIERLQAGSAGARCRSPPPTCRCLAAAGERMEQREPRAECCTSRASFSTQLLVKTNFWHRCTNTNAGIKWHTQGSHLWAAQVTSSLLSQPQHRINNNNQVTHARLPPAGGTGPPLLHLQHQYRISEEQSRTHVYHQYTAHKVPTCRRHRSTSFFSSTSAWCALQHGRGKGEQGGSLESRSAAWQGKGGAGGRL